MKEILDHGYVDVIESWGSDERIVEAARMSTGKGFNGWGGAPCPDCEVAGRLDAHDSLLRTYAAAEQARAVGCKCNGTGRTIGDEKLLAFLYANKHATPFEMAGLVVEVKAPIFVFREWHRHRTQSYNEMSARYTPLPEENYMPTIERLMLNAGGVNKQAGTVAGSDALTAERARSYRNKLERSYAEAEAFYQEALAIGVPKELARVHLPVGRYSRMRASANLRNWLAFLTLRMDKAAQWEIRQYADAVGDIIADRFPRTWALFVEGRRA